MNVSRDIRRLAFQGLFHLDVQGDEATGTLRAVIEDAASSVAGDVREEAMQLAESLARGAYIHRRTADEAVRRLAPDWPPHRQPSVDRALLRLAVFEITRPDLEADDGKSGSGRIPRSNPKVVVNDAIELAKAFSTERSPAFVNAVLDKVLKGVIPARIPVAQTHDGPAEVR